MNRNDTSWRCTDCGDNCTIYVANNRAADHTDRCPNCHGTNIEPQ
jgi:predicted RNA-binding Zn-ribbon protein involved in translation (DUF1610 family)